MKTIVVILLSISISSRPITREVFIDETLKQYVDSFISEGKLYGYDLDYTITVLVEEPPKVNGKTVNGSYSPKDNMIRISPRIMSKPQSVEAIMWHEMGHGYFDREDLGRTKNPTSFMYVYSWDILPDWDSQREILRKEMFNSLENSK